MFQLIWSLKCVQNIALKILACNKLHVYQCILNSSLIFFCNAAFLLPQILITGEIRALYHLSEVVKSLQ